MRARLIAPLLAVGVGWLSLAVPGPVGAADAPAPSPTPALSAHEVARQTIEPIVDIFSREPDGPSRAFSLRARLTESTNQPPELQGSVITFACQPPDKIKFQFAALDTVVTISRVGQQVWVSPASKLRPLLEQVKQKPPTKADKEPLAPLVLKVPKTLFWLFFRFASIRDAGTATVDGVPFRKLDVDPPDDDKPDATKSVRFWVRTDRYQLGRVDWHNTDSHGTLVIEEAKYAKELPASAFGPDAAQKADLLDVPVAQFRPLMTLLGKAEEKRAKAQVAAQKLAAATR